MQFHFYFTFLFFLRISPVVSQNITLLARTSTSIVLLTINLENSTQSVLKTLVSPILEDATILLSSNNENTGFYLSHRTLHSVDIITGETKLLGELGNHITDLPSTFDYDWITENFFIGVQGNRESGGRIEACSLKNVSSCTAVLHDKLDYLYSLVTRSNIGKMFWQSGVTNQIEMSSTNGQNHEREPFNLDKSARYRSLAFHAQSKQLFFVKSINNEHEIVSCPVSIPRQCKTIAKVDDIVNLVVAKNHIVWSMSVHGILNYCQIDRCEETRKTTVFNEIENFVLVDPEQSRDISPCNNRNGGCSHFCLVGDDAKSRTCSCPIGIPLEKDNSTCNKRGVQKIMFISSLNGIFEISLDTSDFTAFPVHFEENYVTKTEDIDYKTSNEMLYWIEEEKDETSRNPASIRYLKRSDRKRSTVETILTLPKTVNRIQIDEVNNNVYWMDNAQIPRIGVTSLSSLFSKTVIFGSIKNIKSFVVHYLENLIIVARDGEQSSVIEAYCLDGSKQYFVEILKPKSYVVDMNIDRKRNLLFWIESSSSDLLCFAIETSKSTRLKFGPLNHLTHPNRIEVSGNDVFIYSSTGRSILKVSLENPDNPITSIIDTPIFGAKGMKVVDFAAKEAPVSSCHQSNGFCDHICVLSRHGQQQCLCADEYFIDPDTGKCSKLEAFGISLQPDKMLNLIPTSQPSSAQILLSDHRELFRTISSFDVNLITGEMIIVGQSNLGLGIIAKIPVLKHSTVGKIDPILKSSIILEGENLDGVFDVAVDYISGNIFWSNTETNRIEVCDSTGKHRKVVAWSQIKPKYIAVDVTGKIVVYQNDNKQKSINRMSMRGEHFGGEQINSESKEILSLAVDQNDNEYYWIEKSDKYMMFSSSIDGSRRELLYAGNNYTPTSLSVLDNVPYFIESDGKLGFYNGRFMKTTAEKLGKSIKLRMFDRRKTLTSTEKNSFCYNNNGRCDQLCLFVAESTTLAPYTSSSPYRDHCTCSDGFIYNRPSSDGNSDQCSPLPNVIVAAKADGIYALGLNGKPGKPLTWRDSPVVKYPVKFAKNRTPKSVSFHPTDRVVFWIEDEDRTVIKFVNLEDSKEVLAVSATATSQCSVFHSLTVDAAGNQLFASCYRNVTGFVIVYQILNNPTGLKYVDVVVSGDAAASSTGLPSQPKEIALFPLRNMMFYVDATPHTLGPASIIKCKLNGNQCSTWLSRNVNANTKLQADPNIESSRLMYTNTAGVWSRDVVSSESNIQHHFGSISNKQNYSVAPIDENSIVISVTNGKTAVVVNGKTENTIEEFENTLTLFRSASLEMQSRICRAAKCSHMCRYVRDKDSPTHEKFECLCPIGFALNLENKRSCTPSVICLPWQHTCADGKQCIHATKKCDEVNDCNDHSDENPLNCKPFTPDQWPCDNGINSVNRTSVCDGIAQCPDASDELHCRCERPSETFDCGAWSQSTSEKCIPRFHLCDRIKNCEHGEDERHAICGKLQTILPDEAQWVYFLLLAIALFLMFLIVVFCCVRNEKHSHHDMTTTTGATTSRIEEFSLMTTQQYNPVQIPSNHVVMNSVVYSASNGSSSCVVLPPPNSSISKPSTGEIPPHRFYAPPPSATSLSTYGVVNPNELRMNTIGTARRRYRTVGPSSSEDEAVPWSSTPKNWNTSRPKLAKPLRNRPPSLPYTPIFAHRKKSSLSSHSSDVV